MHGHRGSIAPSYFANVFNCVDSPLYQIISGSATTRYAPNDNYVVRKSSILDFSRAHLISYHSGAYDAVDRRVPPLKQMQTVAKHTTPSWRFACTACGGRAHAPKQRIRRADRASPFRHATPPFLQISRLMRHMAHEAPANSVAAPMPVPPASQSRPERPPVIGSTPTWGTRLTKVTAAFGVRPVTVGGVPDILPVPRGSVVLQPGTVRSGFVLGDSFEILGEERLRYIIGAAGLHPCTGAVIDVTGLAGRAAPIHAFGSTGHVFSRGRDGESLHAAGRQYDRRQHRDAPKGRTLPRGTPVSHRSRHFRAPPCICSSPDSTTGDASPRNQDIHHP